MSSNRISFMYEKEIELINRKLICERNKENIDFLIDERNNYQDLISSGEKMVLVDENDKYSEDKQVNKTYELLRKSIPSNWINLKPGEPTPKNHIRIKGPRGGEYAKPMDNGKNPKEDEIGEKNPKEDEIGEKNPKEDEIDNGKNPKEDEIGDYIKKLHKKIKKKKGETFLRDIRNYHNGIFEIEDIDKIIEYAGNDAKEIMPFLLVLKKDEIKEVDTGSTSKDLLKKAGYDSFYVEDIKGQNSIKKYFKKSEELCTFNDPERYKKYHIISIIKEGAENLKREDYDGIEKREDEYGRSVSMIQISKNNSGFISIKNRYNHTITNPDNTFNSNPDRIIPGLTSALKRDYGVSIDTNDEAPDGYRFMDNRLYKINYESNGVEVGDDFYIKNGKVIIIDKQTQKFDGGMVFDIKKKKIKSIFENNEGFINKTNEMIKEKGFRFHNNTIEIGGSKFEFDKVGLKSINIEYIKKVESNFLSYSNVKKVDLPNLEEVDWYFGSDTKNLEELNAPKLKKVGSKFLYSSNIKKVDLSNLEKAGEHFGSGAKKLEELNAPKLKKTGGYFLSYSNVKKVDLPNLEEVDWYFGSGAKKLEELNAPKLKKTGGNFLSYSNVKKVDLPNLEKAGLYFGSHTENLEELNAPKLKETEDYFLSYSNVKKVDLSNLEKAGLYFGSETKNLEELNAPKLKKTEGYFLYYSNVKKVDLPNLEEVDWYFGSETKNLEELNAPKLKKTRDKFLFYSNVKKVDLSNLEEVEDNFGSDTKNLEELNAPKLKKTGYYFLSSSNVKKVDLPNLEEVEDNFGSDTKNLEELNVPKLKNKGANFLSSSGFLNNGK